MMKIIFLIALIATYMLGFIRLLKDGEFYGIIVLGLTTFGWYWMWKIKM